MKPDALLGPILTSSSDQQVLDVLAKTRGERVRQAAAAALAVQAPHVPIINPMTSTTGNAVGKGRGVGTGFLDAMTLRHIRESSLILQAIHAARIQQVRRFGRLSYGKPGEIGWRVIHRNHRNPSAVVPPSARKKIRAAEDLLLTPMPYFNRHSMGDVMAGLWEDFATLNRPALEIIRVDGEPTAIVHIDGALLWESSTYMFTWAKGHQEDLRKAHAIHPEDILYEVSKATKVDFFTKKYVQMPPPRLDPENQTPGQPPRYIWVENDVPVRGIRAQDVIVAPALTRTDVRYGLYPPGKVEDVVASAGLMDQAIEYTARFFTDGMNSEQVILLPEDFNGDDLQRFTTELADGTRGLRRAHQPYTLRCDGDKFKIIQLRPGSSNDMAFEALTAFAGSLACAVYRIDPSTVNIKPWDGGSGPRMTDPSRANEIASAREEGLSGDLEHFRLAIFTPIVKLIDPDLEFEIDAGDFDPQKAADLEEKALRTDTTPNELRTNKGKRAIGDFVPDEKWDTASDDDKKKHLSNPLNWPQISALTTVASAISMMQQAQQGGGDGQPDQGDGQVPPGDGQGADGDQGQGDEQPEEQSDDGPGPYKGEDYPEDLPDDE